MKFVVWLTKIYTPGITKNKKFARYILYISYTLYNIQYTLYKPLADPSAPPPIRIAVG